MATNTTNYGLSKPAVDDATDQDLWGGELNTNADSLDGLIKTCLNFTPTAATGTITVTIPTAGSTTTGSAKLLYDCDLTGGAFVANLPAAATASGLHVAFKKTDSSANALTITPNGSEKIDGAATQTLSAQYAYMVLVCNSTGWAIVSQTPPAAVSTGRLLNVQVFTASGTYTPTSGTNSIVCEGIAGGGGGAGSGVSAGTGGTGGTTSLGSLLSCAGGVGGSVGTTNSTIGIGGAGGAVSTATMKLPGSAGGNGEATYSQAGTGGTGAPGMGGSGAGLGALGGSAGGNAGANTGAGGGGAGAGATTNSSGGGGSGGQGKTYATGITGTYTATIGTGGTAGSAGTSGFAGGTGGTGQIIIYEYA